MVQQGEQGHFQIIFIGRLAAGHVGRDRRHRGTAILFPLAGSHPSAERGREKDGRSGGVHGWDRCGAWAGEKRLCVGQVMADAICRDGEHSVG